MKGLNFLLFNLLAISLIACDSSKKDEPDILLDDTVIFFDVVYKTLASREIGTSSWYAVQGNQKIKFDKGENNSGVYTISFDNYKETHLVQPNACSGGYRGTYALGDASESGDGNEDGPYDPMDPYDPGSGGSGDDGELDPNVVLPVAFFFSMTVTETSLQVNCSTSITPQNPHTLRIVRFSNGELVITNYSRNLEFYMAPDILP